MVFVAAGWAMAGGGGCCVTVMLLLAAPFVAKCCYFYTPETCFWPTDHCFMATMDRSCSNGNASGWCEVEGARRMARYSQRAEMQKH